MKRFLLFAICCCGLFLYNACTPDDNFITDSNAKLDFSVDTLRFDTVFSQIGSATRILKIYNRNNRPIKIDKIMVQGGSNSMFRLNIDGDPGSEAEEVKIPANDSLYIFGEVTVDPDQPLSISPYVVEDELIFITNGNTQTVLLEAWGQNANYLPSRFGGGGAALFSCNLQEETWDDPKPYVIYGILVIDECTVRLPAGTRIYVHGGIGTSTVIDTSGNPVRQRYSDGRIVIGPQGRLLAEGTAEDSVVIQGDRLEPSFDDIEGQWFGIIISAGSRGNRFEYTTIKNAIIGVAADSASSLVMKQTQIFNTSSNAVLGIRSTITAENCLFYNNAAGAVRFTYGGDYQFDFCTLASYGVDASALSMSNSLCLNAPVCSQYRPYRLNADFRNSIIFGSRRDEILISQVPEAAMNYNFSHCIVRVEDLLDENAFPNFFDNCNPCNNASRDDKLFLDVSEADYHLDTLSIAEEMAVPLPGITIDLDAQTRDGSQPDIGCFEFAN
ncbi:MAG: hypothetical protein AAGG75_17735 [Bacteroidota bacterium]